MHLLFVHQNYPAQFGHIAAHLARVRGWRCTFVTQKPPRTLGGVELIQCRPRGGATRRNHYCNRTMENTVWHMHAVYEALRARPDVRPDLIVGHAGLGPTLLLRDLYDCPIINFFEYFYRVVGSDMDFRPDFPTSPLSRLRARVRNASLLLDLENCDLGYCPTYWQRDRFPRLFHPKLRVIFDGVDTSLWRPLEGVPRLLAGRPVPPDVRIVTYATRGMESMRGFDIFMRAAKKICDRRQDVIFAVAGQDRICYGGDEQATGKKSFKEWVLSQDNYDLSRFVFLGLLKRQELAALFSLTDLHFYLTVPFVLSWSLLDALACGATVLASGTAPVSEVVQHERNGLLADFFDVDGFADQACRVLDAPRDFKHLGRAGIELVRERYSMEACLPRMVAMYHEAVEGYRHVRTSTR